MTSFQITLILFLLLAGILAWLLLKQKLFFRLFFLMQFLTGIAFVISPHLSTRIATLLGVGRGTDLILYFIVIFVYFAGLCIIGKFRQLERQLTLLTREIALIKAQKLLAENYENSVSEQKQPLTEHNEISSH